MVCSANFCDCLVFGLPRSAISRSEEIKINVKDARLKAAATKARQIQARSDAWGRYEVLGELPYAGLSLGALDVVLDCEEAGHDSGDVAIHHCGPASKCDAGDRTRRVSPNAVEAT